MVVDASVALKWILDEPDSHLAQALAEGEEQILVPDFWLNEATNVCWLQVRKRVWTPDEARKVWPYSGKWCRQPTLLALTFTTLPSTSA